MMWFPDKGNSFIWWPYSAIGKYFRGAGHPGMNEKGLTYVHYELTISPKEKRNGIQSTLAILHTLRFANNAKEAVGMQLGYEAVRGSGSFWGDIDGNAFVIERREPPLVRKAGDLGEVDFLYATNTHPIEDVRTEKQVFVPRRGCFTETSKYRGDRNLQYWNILNQYYGEIDQDEIYNQALIEWTKGDFVIGRLYGSVKWAPAVSYTHLTLPTTPYV